MKEKLLDQNLPLIQEADLEGKVVLIRFDHNVVKKGVVTDSYRIDKSLGTLYNVVERGGRPILMTHIGRPKDKKTGQIKCCPEESVEPIVEYIEQKLNVKFHVPKFNISSEIGITDIDTSINHHIRELKKRNIAGIYLPNTRWFCGEEAKESAECKKFALQLAGLADVFINDAFGSWQPHVSTYYITEYLPSYAGFLLQQEIINLNSVLEPVKPFVAIIAGAKYDTKIGPLYEIYKRVNTLILGGVIYNAFLAAKYNVSIQGISEEDKEAAKKLVEMDKKERKIIELPYIVESDTDKEKIEGKYKTISTEDFAYRKSYGYILDIDPKSFEHPIVLEVLSAAKTIFVNAVMGFTPHFTAGSEALDNTIDKNKDALKLYGGGDTLQVFKSLCPALYLSVIGDVKYHLFTGGGTVLTAIEQGSPYNLKPVKALIENKKKIKSKS